VSVFSSNSFDEHERVIFCRDPRSGLKAIIAIHSTVLGPAVGGCRMWNYMSEDEAISDVLRLSRGMSYKNAMAELPFGGGKAVIIGDSLTNKNERLFEAFGDAVNRLEGDYITAEDVGVSVADMEIIKRRTKYVSGCAKHDTSAGGDPSPKTAYGVYLGIMAAVRFRTGDPDRTDLKGIRVAVQGLGTVGYHLCALLSKAGAELIVADIMPTRSKLVSEEFNATVVPVDQIITQEVDVLAPCALGAVLDENTIPKLMVSIIAGCANNQLASEADGIALQERDILYAPDYVINAGGIINVAHEILNLGDEETVMSEINKISPRLIRIFEESLATGLPTNEIANRMAREKLSSPSILPVTSCAA